MGGLLTQALEIGRAGGVCVELAERIFLSHRRAKQESLHEFAAPFGHDLCLLLSLDPLCHNVEPEFAGETTTLPEDRFWTLQASFVHEVTTFRFGYGRSNGVEQAPRDATVTVTTPLGDIRQQPLRAAAYGRGALTARLATAPNFAKRAR